MLVTKVSVAIAVIVEFWETSLGIALNYAERKRKFWGKAGAG